MNRFIIEFEEKIQQLPEMTEKEIVTFFDKQHQFKKVLTKHISGIEEYLKLNP